MKFLWKELPPLTAEQAQQLIEWEHDPDPSVRFQHNFYTLRRQQLLQEYYADLQEVTGEDIAANDREAKCSFDESMKTLTEMYERDIDLLFQLQAMLNGVFVPWRNADAARPF